MAVEPATYINQLDETLPGDQEKKFEGDNHIRLLKSVMVNCFPNLTGAVTVTTAQLDAAANLARPLQAQIDAKAAINSQTFTGTPLTPQPLPGAPGNQMATVKYVKDAGLVPATLPGQTGKLEWLMTTDGTNGAWLNTIDTSVVKPSGGVDFVTGTGTENLRGKTFPDVKIVDSSNQGKILKFDLTGITTGVTRNVFLDNADMTLAEHREILLSEHTAVGVAHFDVLFNATGYSGVMLESFDLTNVSGVGSKVRVQAYIDGVLLNNDGNYRQSPAYNASDSYDNWNLNTAASAGQSLYVRIAAYDVNSNLKQGVTMLSCGYNFLSTTVRSACCHAGVAGKLTGLRFYTNTGGIPGSVSGTFRVWGVR